MSQRLSPVHACATSTHTHTPSQKHNKRWVPTQKITTQSTPHNSSTHGAKAARTKLTWNAHTRRTRKPLNHFRRTPSGKHTKHKQESHSTDAKHTKCNNKYCSQLTDAHVPSHVHPTLTRRHNAQTRVKRHQRKKVASFCLYSLCFPSCAHNIFASG